ncbi:MAG: DegT/DnrJ/EryC1/StrS family aminotransferase [Methanoregula sp.]
MTKNNKKFLVFGAPAIEQPEIDEVIDCMNKGWLGTGPKVAQFEKDFAAYKGVPYSAAVNSCTAALHLSLLAAGLGPGDEVITTPMTFCATVNTIIHTGATPVLADVDLKTMNIDPKHIKEKISEKTKAILPVHFAGRSCDMDPIMKIAKEYNLKVIEDCAHAIETEYHGKKAGTFGNFGCFSFYTTKNVVTGEGGMVITNDEEAISRIKIMALHGMNKDAWKRFSDEGYKHYLVVEAGYKYNMMDIQAAMGIHQLERVENNWIRRIEIWKRYQEAFCDLPVEIPAPFEPNTRHALHLYTLMIDEKKTGISRDRFLDAMTMEGVGVGVHYLSIPEHPYYQKTFRWNPDDFPNAKKIGRETVSIPLSAKLSNSDIARITHSVKKIIK